jgi:hypothetical protein
MACSVNITSVTGIPATPGSTTTSTIHVTGTLSGTCPPSPSGAVEIVVEAVCGSNSAKATAVPDQAGNWSVDIPLRCTCGGDILVKASCATDPTCTDSRGGTLQCESNCPIGTISISVDGCNPDGTRNVTLTANISFVPAGGAVGQWHYGDGTLGLAVAISAPGSYPDPGGAHHYAPPGPANPAQFVWILPATCPPLSVVISGLESCPLDCPEGQITATPPGDCEPGGTRMVTLNAVISGGTPQFYYWDFGDGTNSGTINASQFPPGPVDHHYPAPGTSPTTYTAVFVVTAFNGLCTKTASLPINIPGCGGEQPPPPPPNGEGGGCKGLRWAGVIAAILAALALYICQCVPMAGVAFCYISLGLAILAAVLLGLWLLFCPKPCGAALLIAWQIALGAGIGALYFAPCCPTLWIIGAALIAAAVAGLIVWIRRCKKTRCQVLAELGVVITVVIVPIIGWIAGISFLQPCLNPIVAATVSTLSAIVALGLSLCASKAPEPAPPTM